MLLPCDHNKACKFNHKPLFIALSLLIPVIGQANDSWYSPLFTEGSFSLVNTNEISGEETWSKDDKDHITSYEAIGAISANYESGYVGDKNVSMGFGLGAAFAYKIGQRNPDTSLGGTDLAQTDCEPDQDGKVFCGGTKNKAKLSQMNVRLRLGKRNNKSLNSKVGVGYFEAGMIKSFDPDKDLLPTSYRGLEVQSRLGDVSISGAVVTGMMKGGETSIQKLVYEEDKANPTGPSVYIDHVAGIQLQHKLGPAGYTIGYAYAKGYKQRLVATANYRLDLTSDSTLRFDAAYNRNWHEGQKWDEAIAKGIEEEGKDKAHLTSMRLRYEYRDDFRLGLGWSTTGGNMGFNRYLAGVDTQWVSYGQGYINKFRAVDNTSQRLEVVYWPNDFDVPVLKDMRLRYQFVWGEDEHAGQDENETGSVTEHVFDVVYTKPSGRFAGTQASFKIGKAFADEIWAKPDADEPGDIEDSVKFKFTVSVPLV